MPTSAPIFILASARSFTSLICAMIGQHPELLGVPELNLFQAATVEEFWTGRAPDGRVRWPVKRVMRHDGILRTVAQVYAGEQTIDSIDMAKRWISSRLHQTTDQAHRELCDAIAPLRVVDKSPGYVRRQLYLDRMLEAFPDARFIHLVRHPRGQGESVMKMPGGSLVLCFMNSIDRTGPRPIIDPQIVWHDSQIRILRFLDKLPQEQWMRLRGEDVLRDIRGYMNEICRFLEIADDDDALDAMMRPELSPFACFGPLNARQGNDPNFLESPAFRSSRVHEHNLEEPLSWRDDGKGFHPRVAELARSLGYH